MPQDFSINPSYQKMSYVETQQAFAQTFVTDHTAGMLLGGGLLLTLGAVRLARSWNSPASLLLSGAGFSITMLEAYRWKHVLTYLVSLATLSPEKAAPDMHEHMFTDRTCHKDGVEVARVYYDSALGGDVPVLELNTSNPSEMGFIQGYLLGDKIEALFDDILRPMITFSGVLVGDVLGSELDQKLSKIVIPPQYLQEMNGLLQGMEKYCQERGKPMKLTLRDLILAHGFADIRKSIGCQKILGFKGLNVIGCTTFALKDSNGNMRAGRTLDWPGFKDAGKYMIVRRHKTDSGMTIETHTLPGVLHALTGKNSAGLVSIINELGITSIGGVPYGLHAREILENATSVEEGRKLLSERIKNPNQRAASSHHLILIDSKEASNFQMYVRDTESFLERKLSDCPDKMLLVINHAIDEEGSNVPGSEADDTSHARHKAVLEAHKKNEPQNLSQTCVKEYLKAANVLDTISANMFMISQDHPENVQVHYAHGSFYAVNNIK